MSDDRFEKDSTIYSRPEKPGEGLVWDEAITPYEYFVKAFELKKETHHLVQTLKLFYPSAYDRAKRSRNE